jgi:general secretion pathway protein A
MEEIRMLSNIETEKHHLIQIILIGQPELKFKLQQSNLKQFAQRVTVHCHLKGLEKDEVAEYIRHRLEVGGSKQLDIFKKETIERIAEYSRGIPRLINVLCDSSLVYGFADELKSIDIDILENVYEELKTLGIFTDYDTKPSANPPAPKSAVAGPTALDPRIEIVEGKVKLLEDKIGVLEEKLDFFSDKRIERDDIVIELLKVLKTNLDSRSHLVRKLYRDGINPAGSDETDYSGGSKAGSSSKVSSFQKLKQKKNS